MEIKVKGNVVTLSAEECMEHQRDVASTLLKINSTKGKGEEDEKGNV